MVMPFVNETGTMGVIYNAINFNVTGSEFLTLLLIVLFCMLIVMAFRMPLEASAIIVLPMMIVFMSFNNNLFAVGGVFLIYAGLILAKNWFLR